MSPLRCRVQARSWRELPQLGFAQPHDVDNCSAIRYIYKRIARRGKQRPSGSRCAVRHINRRVAAYGRGDAQRLGDTKKKNCCATRKTGAESIARRESRSQSTRTTFRSAARESVPYGVYDLPTTKPGSRSASRMIRPSCGRLNCAVVGTTGLPALPHLITVTDHREQWGSNGHRNPLWKHELQRLAYTTGMVLAVCHYPPGTSKWNKIEHRLFQVIAGWLAKWLPYTREAMQGLARLFDIPSVKPHTFAQGNGRVEGQYAALLRELNLEVQ